MKNLALIESIFWYIKDNDKLLLIIQVCPYILDRIDWVHISRNQKLSEEFIIKFQERLDWEYISTYQKLSEEFIIKFHAKFELMVISRSFWIPR